MAIRQGRCTNFGNCGTADRKQVVPIADGADFVCPECSRPLTDMGRAEKSGSPVGIVLGILLLLLFLGGVGAYMGLHGRSAKAPAPASSPASGGETILRLSGSNTIGSELVPALAQAFLKQLGASDARIVPGANGEEKTVEGTLPGNSVPSLIQIQAHGSATAFTALADASADIGMASRKINPGEISRLSSLGDMTSPASEHILGLDGIAVIVNQANPATSLTKGELAKIFSGATTTWPAGGAIKIYARDDKSGTFDTFKSLVLGGTSLASSAQRFEDSAALSDAVANDANGIGFIGLPYVRSAKAIAVAEAGAMPMLPNRFTVATEDYPLSRRLFSTPRRPRRISTFANLCSLLSPRAARTSWPPMALLPRTLSSSIKRSP